MKKQFLSVIVFVSFTNMVISQTMMDSTFHPKYKLPKHHWGMIDSTSDIHVANFIAPAVFITYGALAVKSDLLEGLNFSTRAEIKEDHPFFKTHIDNYAQFAPAATVFALQTFGVKGKNPIKDEAIIYATSMAIVGAIDIPTKHWVHELRPDSSNYLSFPSGHTSTAFASAEFLRIEYWHTSPWIGIGGYVVAIATGGFRMYNNKHWFSDVVAGAGIGIASTDLAYILHDKFFHGKNKDKSLSIFPTYNNGTWGIGLVKKF